MVKKAIKNYSRHLRLCSHVYPNANVEMTLSSKLHYCRLIDDCGAWIR